MSKHEDTEHDARGPVRKLLDEPRYVIGKRRSDRTAALMFLLVAGGGGWHEVRMRSAEHEDNAVRTQVTQLYEQVHALSERIVRLESIAPSEAQYVQDTLKRIESRLDKIDNKLDTKADRRRGW